MHVNDEQGSNYWAVEDFWSGIHKQSLSDKKILGWDLWSLIPSGTKQGSQYFTVTLFPCLQAMMETATSWDAIATAKKAYPKMTEKELNAMMENTVKSHDVANQVFIKEIDKTKDDFEMKPGIMATMDIMKQLDDSYEKIESEVFKPWHQQMVKEGKKGNWDLLQVILPAGSKAYGTHLTVSMFRDAAQIAAFMEGGVGTIDFTTQTAVNQGLKTRD